MGGTKPARWRIVALTYGCDTCGAPPGQPCITYRDTVRETEVHAARSYAASANRWQAADVPNPERGG